jgi:hypothetical protein
MQTIKFFQDNPYTLIALYWIYSSLVTTMPSPLPTERWYSWLYNFLQAIAANLDRIGMKQSATEKKESQILK